MEMMESILTLNNLDRCQVCRYCCWSDRENMTIIFLDMEIAAIRETYQKMPRFLPYKESSNVFQVELGLARRESGGFYYVCPFLDVGDHRCRIYEKRPLDCRLWPFFFSEDKENGEVNISYFAGSCLAFNRASGSMLAIYQQYIIEILTSAEYLRLLREYPELVWEYKPNEDVRKIRSIEPGLKT